jgi:hypothetical protein
VRVEETLWAVDKLGNGGRIRLSQSGKTFGASGVGLHGEAGYEELPEACLLRDSYIRDLLLYRYMSRTAFDVEG